jgi:hypothetical protein
MVSVIGCLVMGLAAGALFWAAISMGKPPASGKPG